MTRHLKELHLEHTKKYYLSDVNSKSLIQKRRNTFCHRVGAYMISLATTMDVHMTQVHLR